MPTSVCACRGIGCTLLCLRSTRALNAFSACALFRLKMRMPLTSHSSALNCLTAHIPFKTICCVLRAARFPLWNRYWVEPSDDDFSLEASRSALERLHAEVMELEGVKQVCGSGFFRRNSPYPSPGVQPAPSPATVLSPDRLVLPPSSQPVSIRVQSSSSSIPSSSLSAPPSPHTISTGNGGVTEERVSPTSFEKDLAPTSNLSKGQL